MIMSRVDAEKYKSELASRYWNGFISFKKYNELYDEIELIPYDLTQFPSLTENTIIWINKLFDKAPETSRRGNFMLRGFTRAEGAEMRILGLKYGDYADALNFYAYNDDEMLLYTFCEGDTTLELFSTREAYEKEKETTRQWYKEERSA